MKLSDGFLLRQVCGETLLMPVGEKTKEFNGIFTLPETGAFLLGELKKGADAAAAAESLAKEYDIDPQTALQDTRDFMDQLLSYGILTEE
ncbi:MAG: PqqD family protein [Clostridia bacterium]|nr:PqqD family protein [Clostridia bacterium]